VPSLLGRISTAIGSALSHHEPGPTIGFVPPGQCFPPGVAGYTIDKGEMYFEVRAHELFLARNQILWATHDPMAVVAVEFGYGSERITLPKVIGPDLISAVRGPAGSSANALHGTVLTNTLIAGPHPYRGGNVDVTVRLFAVERANHAQMMLRTVEQLSSAFGDPGGISMFEKTGEALVSAMEAVFGLTKIRYLAGARLSTRMGNRPFEAGYVAVIAPPVPPLPSIAVHGDSLRHSLDGTSWQDSDYVLIGIHGLQARGDENRFPFDRLRERALRAVGDGKGSWERAKGLLVAAYQDMRVSPDLTLSEARRLFDQWMFIMQAERKRMAEVENLGPAQRINSRSAEADELDEALRRLDAPN
jgi:hypothetical protein